MIDTSLQPATSRASHVNPVAPIEAHTGSGPELIAHHSRTDAEHAVVEQNVKSSYIFKRLRGDRPLPGRKLMGLMLAALFTVMFLAGWNDASQGPLLPSLQENYNVDYLIISVIWIASFVGFLTAGLANVFITDRVGFGIAAPFGSCMQGAGYALMCWGSPYPLFVIAYILVGFGLGLQDAQVNSLTSRLPSATTKMFLMHAFYGLGATVSPLVSTEFVKQVPNRVYLYFTVSLGLAVVTGIALVLVFKGRTEDQVVGRRVAVPPIPPAETAPTVTADNAGEVSPLNEKTARPHSEEQKENNPATSGAKLKEILTCAHVQYMAFYLTIYVGVEVTIGGWVTTFLLEERGGTANVGYVTTGYFGGLTLGRVILIPVTKWLGKNNSVYIFTILAIILEILVWTIDSLPANGVFFALVGFVLGPMYPIVMMVVVDVIPGELQGGAIGWMASLGQAGSAIMPFITGGIANHYGPWILQPLVIAFMGASLVLWFLVPRPAGVWV